MPHLGIAVARPGSAARGRFALVSPTELMSSAGKVAADLFDPIVDLTFRLTEIGSPTFEENQRAEALADILRDEGYEAVQVDDISNVTARIPGKNRDKALVVAAHIDTVFPAETEIAVRRDGDTAHAPGIGDNTVAVATVAMLKRAFDQLGVQPAVDVVVCGNVGEEGLGDLRGIKRVIADTPEVVGVLAIEGHWFGRITHIAVGSKRYRVTVTGKGGHSWGDAGVPSAIHHMCQMIAKMDDIPLSTEPKVSFNAGVVDGGVSVNTIAPEVHAILDMRSTDAAALQSLSDQVDAILDIPRPDGINVQVENVGDRPAGAEPIDGVLVPIASRVLRDLGYEPVLDDASTDANVPISMGIPAICIGVSTGGNIHRTDEWINLSPIKPGFQQLVAVVIEAAESLSA